MQSALVALAAYFLGFVTGLLPFLTAILITVFIALGSLFVDLIKGMPEATMLRHSDSIFHSAVMAGGKYNLINIFFAPIIYTVIYFFNMFRQAMHHWSGIIEIGAFLLALHTHLTKYRERFQR